MMFLARYWRMFFNEAFLGIRECNFRVLKTDDRKLEIKRKMTRICDDRKILIGEY